MVDPSGAAPFSGIVGPETPSVLGLDYVLLQRDQPIDDAWRSAVEAAGGTIIGVHRDDTLNVAIADGWLPVLQALPTARWAGRWRAAYKPAAPLAPVLEGGDFTHLLDETGQLPLLAVFHRHESASDHVSAIQALIPAASLVTVAHADGTGLHEIRDRVRLKVAPAAADTALRVLALQEAIAYVELGGSPAPLVEESAWYVQTALLPSDAPADGSTWRYDTTAKLAQTTVRVPHDGREGTSPPARGDRGRAGRGAPPAGGDRGRP